MNGNLFRTRFTILVVFVSMFFVANAIAAINLPMVKIPSTNNPGVDLSGQLNINFLSEAEAVSTYGAFAPAMGVNDVLLTIQNLVGTVSNIAEVYVNGGSALSMLSSPPSPLVLAGFHSFGVGSVNPGNLPGGSWTANQSFSADVSPGPPSQGLNQAVDILGLVYTTNAPSGLTAVQNGLDSGTLRVGVHIRSIAPLGGSDSYENSSMVIPEASSIAVWASLACIGATIARRKRR